MQPGSRFFKNYFKNKKILITGNTGFKGSWLSFLLKEMGAKVYGLSIDVPTNPSNYKCLNLNKDMKTFFGDVTNFKFFEKIIYQTKPNIIFHLAAQSIVSKSYTDPKYTVNSNSIGVLNLLEILRISKRYMHAVIITSDKCYLPQYKSFFSENDILGGEDLYSASKAAAEIYFSAYCQSFFKNKKNIKICSARAGNVIGGGDWSKNRIVPDILRTVQSNKKLILRNPNANRPWQHVIEPVFAYLLLAKNIQNKKINLNSFNIGPSTTKNISVKRIAELLFKKLNYNNKIIIKKNFKFKETYKLNLNTSKIRKTIGWKKILSTDLTFEFISEWYNAFKSNKKNEVIKVTRQQLNRYFKKAINACK